MYKKQVGDGLLFYTLIMFAWAAVICDVFI